MREFQAFAGMRTVQDWQRDIQRFRYDPEALDRLLSAATTAGVNPALRQEIEAAARLARAALDAAERAAVPDAVCRTSTVTDGRPSTCGALLLHLPEAEQAGGNPWVHLPDRCANCWDTSPPAFHRCEWATQHDSGLCDHPQPVTCSACGSVVNPEMAIGGHTACAAPVTGRCCGCCGGGAYEDVDPDAIVDALRDARLEAGER